jgi:DNA-directed RNA polymerase specialized sigma24 family protein
MSRKSSQRKRARQRKRHERRSRELAAPTNLVSGLEEQAHQLPSASWLSRFSTADLIEEISERLSSPQRSVFHGVLAEAIREQGRI